MRLLIKFCLIATFLLLSSCGDVCPGGKDIDYLPEGYKEPVEGLINYTEWIFINGVGEYDTLQGMNEYMETFSVEDCYEEQFGLKEFTWTFLKNCKGEGLSLEVWNEGQTIGVNLLSDDLAEACMEGDYSYDLSSSRFTTNPDIVSSFVTPMKKYTEVTVLPFRYLEQNETLFYTAAEGIVAYTSNTDTFRIKELR